AARTVAEGLIWRFSLAFKTHFFRGALGDVSALQKVTVEHVHVHEGGQAIVGNVESRGEGSHRKRRNNPMHQALRAEKGSVRSLRGACDQAGFRLRETV